MPTRWLQHTAAVALATDERDVLLIAAPATMLFSERVARLCL
jgi:hypothetical protein